jgi:uncharacterized membrane protein
MDDLTRLKGLKGIFRAAVLLLTGLVIIPLVIGITSQTGVMQVLGFIGSVLILQPMAVVVGLGLGISPVPIMLILTSFGISTTFGLFTICDMFAEKSVWLRKHLVVVETIAQKSVMFQRYGIITLIPFIWIPGVGLYGCVLIAWLFKWRGVKGVGIILAGWILSTLFVLGTSLGILSRIH